MIVLGLDTSDYTNAVGIVDGVKVLADSSYDVRTDSLEQIVANIDATLQNAGLTLKDVEGIGVGLGPGSWTGIRVGVTVGKMLAFSTGKPVAGISILDALAYGAHDIAPSVCAVISAGTRDAVYAALYHTGNDTIERVGEYYVGDVTGLTSLLSDTNVIVGNGARAYGKIIEKESGITVKAVDAVPNGASVARLAEQRLSKGDNDDVLSLTPLYLKESTAKAFVNKYRSRYK